MPQGYFSDRYFAGYFPDDYLPDAVTGVTYSDLAGAGRGESGGVAAFDRRRVAPGVVFVAGTDAYATAEIVYPHTTSLRAALGGENVTVLTPLAAAFGAAQGETFGRAAGGGTGYTDLTPRGSAGGGSSATFTALRAAQGGTSGPGRGLAPARTGASVTRATLQPAGAGIGGA